MQQSIRLQLVAVYLSFCCTLLLQPTVHAQVPYPGSCPQVKLLEEFDLDAYMGIWYEYAKYPFVFEIGKKCIYARYENLGNNTVDVLNVAVSRFSNSNSSIQGKAIVMGPGQLSVVFNRAQPFPPPNYIVLGTDYTSYALVYSCVALKSLAHTRIVWILTRERMPSEDTIAAAKQVMVDNNLSQSFLMDTLQEASCPSPVNKSDDQAIGESTEAQVASSSEVQLELTGSNANSNLIDQA